MKGHDGDFVFAVVTERNARRLRRRQSGDCVRCVGAVGVIPTHTTRLRVFLVSAIPTTRGEHFSIAQSRLFPASFINPLLSFAESVI